ncbi:hypothetical protein QWY86_15280 [Pedobacter aquatilis]|uniref:hypothetical protein n=1 Tax=Pedobacter aquatilis TaxID=351343 RepID=UPI0025B5ACDA|nr:hypothetical protein [Pedobacter aquatilis]MDN3588044.1 hypothetical protein [Pedobacter aquatilis]
MAKNNKAKKISQTDKEKELEKLGILASTENVKGEQLFLNENGNFEKAQELKEMLQGNTEDPEKKFDIYYKGIQKILISNLPKGKENKLARNYIYEEKNTYLTRGKRKNKFGIRGADGRMGYISDAEEMLQLIMDWIFTNGTMVDLYNKLREINILKGYGKPTV